MATAVASSLAEIPQNDFSRGMFRQGSRESIPANGAYDLTNVLLQADGKPYRRAGSAFKSTTFDSPNHLYALWDGALFPGQRTAFLSSANRFGVLASDDVTPVTLYNTTLTPAATGPIAPVRVGNHLVFPATTAFMYAGSRLTTTYNAGSVAVTLGSRVVTGSGTLWTSTADPGAYIAITGDPNPYLVQSVDSATSITLDRAYASAGGSGKPYIISGGYSFSPNNTLFPTAASPKLASISRRLAYSTENQVGFSDLDAPYAYSVGNRLTFSGEVLALASVRDTLLVFTTAGMYAIGGLANATPSDAVGNALWSYQLANADLIAWSHEGISGYGGRAVVPCLDGIWMVDPTSGPRRISDNIRDLYLSYVRTSGYTTGVAAVHAGHYFLPILNGTTWVDTLVCRLDSQAWTRLAGGGAKMYGFASRQASPTVLLGADSLGTRVLSLDYFRPSASLKNDHDATAHAVSITTRDIPAPGDQPVMWKRVRLWQEGTVDSGSPTASVAYQRPQDGSAAALNGSAAGAGASASTVTAISDGSGYSWWGENIKRAKQIRFTITTSGALSSWVLHRFSAFFRQSGRQ